MADWQTISSSIAPWALTVGVLVLLGIQAVLSRRRIQRLEARFRDRLEIIGRELHATSSGSMGVGQRLIACERGLHELRTAVDEMRQNDPLRISYDEASRLVDLGADIDDLMNTCGISRPEAELVSALRRRQVA
jgi:Flp pilus assembly protein TadB